MIIIVIASISIFSISKATKLQTLSSSQRNLVRKEIFLQEEEMWHADSQENIKEDLNELRSANALLEQVDESINFNDSIGVELYSKRIRVKFKNYKPIVYWGDKEYWWSSRSSFCD